MSKTVVDSDKSQIGLFDFRIWGGPPIHIDTEDNHIHDKDKEKFKEEDVEKEEK